jgi:hypothetical protein
LSFAWSGSKGVPSNFWHRKAHGLDDELSPHLGSLNDPDAGASR